MTDRNEIVIIGGGAAGMAAAIELSYRGIPSTIVEISDEIGGFGSRLGCKGLDACIRCDICTVESLRRKVLNDKMIKVETRSEVVRSDDKCDGLEVEISSPAGRHVSVAAGVIVAIGAEPFDAERASAYHYGEFPDIITSLDAESMLRTGGLIVPSTGKVPTSVAVIQCVGSRDVMHGVPFCSKVCCKYALKLAQLAKMRAPDLAMKFFIMDWRPISPEDDIYAWAAKVGGVEVVRARPSEIFMDEGLAIRFATPSDDVKEESFDLILLSIGMRPVKTASCLAHVLGLKVTELGQLLPRKGVLVAGCCARPQDIPGSISEGVSAAGRAAMLYRRAI